MRKNFERGKASTVLLEALAIEAPNGAKRATILDSEGICLAMGLDDPSQISKSQRGSLQRALGRLIGQKDDPKIRTIDECLKLNYNDEKVGLTEKGIVAISIDIKSLREEAFLIDRFGAEELTQRFPQKGPFLDQDGKPSQTKVVEKILSESRDWIALANKKHGLSIAIEGAEIVHGSIEFDLFVYVRMSDENFLLNYVRDVIQGIPHVGATQTMIVSQAGI